MENDGMAWRLIYNKIRNKNGERPARKKVVYLQFQIKKNTEKYALNFPDFKIKSSFSNSIFTCFPRGVYVYGTYLTEARSSKEQKIERFCLGVLGGGGGTERI